MHCVVPVPLDSSVLQVWKGRVRGGRQCFLLVRPMELSLLNRGGSEFDSRIVCEGGERLMTWRCQGVDMCVGMACGSICWHICRTCLWWQNRRSHTVIHSLVNTEMKNKWSDEPLTNYGNWRACIHICNTRVNKPMHYSTSYLSISFMNYCTFHQPAKNCNVLLHYL